MNKRVSQIKFNEEELSRYERQICLNEIGIEGQRKIKSSSVLCVGSGGLGSPVLQYLAAAGIGRLGVVDYDKVESSNLHRQLIHKNSSLGKLKTDSAKSSILDINPYCSVTTFDEILNKKNIINIIKSFDIICDCSDNFPTKFLINDACVILKKTNVYASIASFEGQVSVFNQFENSPNLRDIIPEPPPIEIVPNCSDTGVMGILPGIIGTIQASEVIKIVTEIGDSLNGRLLVFNALQMKFKELKVNKISKHEFRELKEYEGFCFDKEKYKEIESVEEISVKELKGIITKGEANYILIDVRSKNEYRDYSISYSINYPKEEIENKKIVEEIKTLSAGKKIFFHCKRGKSSVKTILKLKKYGINGINVKGGIEAWKLIELIN